MINEEKEMKIFKYICLLAILVSTNAMSQSLVNDSIITIEASLSENASFQGMWNIKIIEFHDSSRAELEFTKSDGLSGVGFTGSSALQKDSLLLIKLSIAKQEYFKLPEFIAPDAKGFDMPNYRLKICENDKCHKVQLYQPKSIRESEEMIRFVKVWDTIMRMMPEWPNSWPQYE
jgi:hypothetical protein